MDNVQEGEFCSLIHEQASGKGCGQREEEQTFSPAPKARAQTDEKLPSKISGNRGKTPSGIRGRFPCRDFYQGECTNSPCNCWHPHVFLNYKSETVCAYGKSADFHMLRLMVKPANSRTVVRVQLP